MNLETDRTSAPARRLVLLLLALSACSSPSYANGTADASSLGSASARDRVAAEAGAASSAGLDGSPGAATASDAAHAREAGRPGGPSAAGDAGARQEGPEAAGGHPDTGAPSPTMDEASDAGTAPPVAQPGGPPADVLPAWASELPGEYAMLSGAFSQDDFGYVIRSEERALVTLEQRPDGLFMRVRSCSAVSTSAIATTQVDVPSALAVREHRLKFAADETFSSEPIPVSSGYRQEIPPGCEGKENQLVPKQQPQPWIDGPNCRCPSAADGRVTVDDCRVLDPDGDNWPGLRGGVKPKGEAALLGPAVVHGVIDHRAKFLRGRRRADNSLFAQHDAAEIHTQLLCMPRGCADISRLAKPCPASDSYAEFVPLMQRSGGWTCEALLPQFSALFTASRPAPGTCL